MGVIYVAQSYLGETEKPKNSGFNDSVFEVKIIAMGWQVGQAWCSYFAELCFKEALPDKKQLLNKLFSASAVQTFDNFKTAGYTISTVPVLGSLVIWQTYEKGKPIWTGHAGIVTEVVANDIFKSIEGNTSDGKNREGYIVNENYRVIKKLDKGLNVMGFIIIK